MESGDKLMSLNFMTVGDFVSVKSSKNHKAQQRSTSSVEQVQYQSLKNNKFQQSSTGFRIWFGTRGSGFQQNQNTAKSKETSY